MSTAAWAIESRRDRRHLLDVGESAWVEFDYPSPSGPRWRLPLLDVSVAGLSFILPDELLGIDCGATLRDVVVRVGDCELQGSLVVMHVSPDPASYSWTGCGALFYPATEADQLKLKNIIARIEAAQTS